MKKLYSVAALLCSVLTLNAQTTETYNIPFSQTIGLQMTSGDICSAPFSIEEAFQQTAGNTWGCTWTSTNNGTATSVEITVAFTVTDGGGNFPTTLNGTSSNNVTDGSAKACEPSTILTWTIDPSSYTAGGSNTFLVDFGTATNVSQVDNLPFKTDSYMQVTVMYDTCGTVDTSVTQNLETLTANASNATFQWIDCSSGNPIPGETGSSFTATGSGSYAVIVTDNSTGCADTSSCRDIIVGSVNEYFQNSLDLYPNPTNQNISVDLSEFTDQVTLSVYDLQGRLVLTENVLSGAGRIYTLELDDLSTGQYRLTAVSDNYSATAGFVKE